MTTPPHLSRISLNTDIGEGYGAWSIADDDALLQIVTDANLACGFHASDPDIMRSTCARARELGVSVGAQVGFPDLRGFGRRHIDMDPRSLANDILYQLGALSAFAKVEGIPLAYVKLHGALYHSCLTHDDYARAYLDAVEAYDATLPLLLQPATPLAEAAESRGLRVIREGYLDRAYTAEGRLVPRGTPGAVITDPQEVSARAVQLVTERTVTSIDGTTLDHEVDSVCVHSDSPGAVALAAAVSRALSEQQITLTPLGGAPAPDEDPAR